MSEENVDDFIRQAYSELNKAFREPSGEALRGYLEKYWHPGATYVNPREAPEPGDHVGIDAIWTQFRRWVEPIPDLQVDPLEIRANGNRAFVSVRFSGHGAGSVIPIEMDVAQVVTVENGKVRRSESFTEREEALEAAGLSD